MWCEVLSCSVCLQGEKWSKWTCVRSSICIYGCAGFSPAQLQGAPSATTLQVMQCATSEPSASMEFIAMSLSLHFMMSQQGSRGFSSGSAVKNLPAMQENQARDMGLIPGSGRSPGERKWQPTPVFLPGKLYGQRSLVGYSPWGCKESDTTERLHSLTHSLNCSILKITQY